MVELVSSLSSDGKTLTVTGPPTSQIYPPGPAWVFVLANGVPSVGQRCVHLVDAPTLTAQRRHRHGRRPAQQPSGYAQRSEVRCGQQLIRYLVALQRFPSLFTLLCCTSIPSMPMPCNGRRSRCRSGGDFGSQFAFPQRAIRVDDRGEPSPISLLLLPARSACPIADLRRHPPRASERVDLLAYSPWPPTSARSSALA